MFSKSVWEFIKFGPYNENYILEKFFQENFFNSSMFLWFHLSVDNNKMKSNYVQNVVIFHYVFHLK